MSGETEILSIHLIFREQYLRCNRSPKICEIRNVEERMLRIQIDNDFTQNESNQKFWSPTQSLYRYDL